MWRRADRSCRDVWSQGRTAGRAGDCPTHRMGVWLGPGIAYSSASAPDRRRIAAVSAPIASAACNGWCRRQRQAAVRRARSHHLMYGGAPCDVRRAEHGGGSDGGAGAGVGAPHDGCGVVAGRVQPLDRGAVLPQRMAVDRAAVCAYLTERAAHGVTMATLDVACSAVAHMHRNHGIANPATDESVRQVRAGLRRKYGKAPHRQARQLRAPEFRLVIDHIDQTRPIGVRNTAIILRGAAMPARCADPSWSHSTSLTSNTTPPGCCSTSTGPRRTRTPAARSLGSPTATTRPPTRSPTSTPGSPTADASAARCSPASTRPLVVVVAAAPGGVHLGPVAHSDRGWDRRRRQDCEIGRAVRPSRGGDWGRGVVGHL